MKIFFGMAYLHQIFGLSSDEGQEMNYIRRNVTLNFGKIGVFGGLKISF